MNYCKFSVLVLFCCIVSYKAFTINIEEGSKSSESSSTDSSETGDQDVLTKLSAMDTKLNEILKKIDGEDNTIIYQGCLNGWVSNNDSCYRFGADPVNFSGAKAYCLQFESQLVSVETTDESAFLKSFMKSIQGGQSSASYWLGLTETLTENVWVWQDGQDATFFDWSSSEPDQGTSEGCVWFEQGKSYQWSDVTCNRATRPVCEKRKSRME